MRIAKLLVVLMMVAMFSMACSQTGDKRIADQPGYGVVSVAEKAAPLPKIAKIQEIVYFDFDKKVVREDSLQTLDKVAELMKANPDTVLALTGHTDKYGSDEYNLSLSKARAETVKAELVSRGVPADMISIEWFGKGNLISKIHKENRRVLILSVD